MEFEFGTIMEFIVLGAISIELFALYQHSKLDNRIDEHILDTDRNLGKYNVTIEMLHNNMRNLDERLIRLDEHMNKLYEHMIRYDEHMIRYDAHMTLYDEHMNKLDEHMNRLDDLLWKSYIQNTENINNNQKSKDKQTRQ